MATNEQMKTEFAFFSEVWVFFKRFYEVQDNDSYWAEAVDEAGRIASKYDNNKLCRDLILAVVDELDRKYRELRKMPQNGT